MKKVLLLGNEDAHVLETCDALVSLGHSVLVVAPEVLDTAGTAGVAQVCADPVHRIGQGQVGDLLRQRGPFDAIVQCVPAAAAPLAVTGLDEDDELLAAMALHLVLCKGAIASPNPSGATRLVALRQVTRAEALDDGLAGFFAGMAGGLGDLPIESEDLLVADTDWSVPTLAKRLAVALG